jgi:hypothetical protein
MTAGNESNSTREPTPEPVSGDAPEVRTVIQRAAGVLQAWSIRMTQAAISGRSATTGARMATARAVAEVRQIALPPQTGDGSVGGELRQSAEAYLKRLKSTLTRAAHEVERNRYSLDAMQVELEHLERLYATISPPEEGNRGETETADTVKELADSGGGADDGSADGEVGQA